MDTDTEKEFSESRTVDVKGGSVRLAGDVCMLMALLQVLYIVLFSRGKWYLLRQDTVMVEL